MKINPGLLGGNQLDTDEPVLSAGCDFSRSVADGTWISATADIDPIIVLAGVPVSLEWHLPLRELWGHLKEDMSSLPWPSLFLVGTLREVRGTLCHLA